MKRTLKNITLIMFMTSMVGCCELNNDKPMEIDNSLTQAEMDAGILTPEVMWKMGRVGSQTLSPDGTKLAYTVTEYSVEENKGQTSIFVMPAEGGQASEIVINASTPRWADDNRLYYLSSESGDNQLWSVDALGNGEKQITNVEGGIEQYGVTEDASKMFYIKSVLVGEFSSAEVYPSLDKSKALIYDDLMVRHWDYWERGYYKHIFVADLGEEMVESGKDIMPNEPWDAPMAPYFSSAEIAWNNAGTKLAYTCKKMVGKVYAVSTDSDIYIYDVASGKTNNICKEGETPNGMVGYDKYPVWSPDDSQIAFRSMRRAENESDKDRLFVYNCKTAEMKDLTADFDFNISNVVWEGENTIYFVAPMYATHQICKVDMNGKVDVLTEGDHDINAFTKVGDEIVANMNNISKAVELYAVKEGKLEQLTFVNKHIYDHITMGNVEKRWVRTTDGKEMLTWVIFPPNFDASKKYPTLLYCQGGPQSVVSQFWSYRWNFQLMAAQGYIVVAPNRRGLPSFGQEWLDQISGDYGGQNIKDQLSAIDDVAKESWCDKDRLGAVGASYGGYAVFYLAGHHNNRFKAFISHCGIFNFESMYGHTEEMWFVNNDYGGAYWDKWNLTAQRSYRKSPHKFVDKWNTPILIFTGAKDYRIPYTQSLEAYTAAQLNNVPSRLVVFENEAHQVFKPQNSLVWNREFFGWLDKYLKE